MIKKEYLLLISAMWSNDIRAVIRLTVINMDSIQSKLLYINN